MVALIYYTVGSWLVTWRIRPGFGIMGLQILQSIIRGVATGGIIGIYTPKPVTVLFTCGTLTHVVLKLQWLVKTYTPPNQIPGYATVQCVHNCIGFLGRKINLSVISPAKRSRSGPNSVYVDRSRGDIVQGNLRASWLILAKIGPGASPTES